MGESEKVKTKCYIVILSLFITVSSAQHRSQNDYNNRNRDDEWVWGYAVDTKPNNVPANPDRTYDTIKDPCTPYNPPKPNFNALGRRICEKKCYEYIWELKTRHESNLRSEECMRDWENSDPNYIPPSGAIGGRVTEPGEFPHMGAIGWQASSGTWVFKCGSSLISSKFVLTAGHCSRASDRDTTIADPVPKIVRLGDKNIIDVYTNGVLPTDAKIINIIVHPKYHPPKKYYDIALMELEDHVVFSKYIQPACLWTKFNTSTLGSEATVTGWGVVETIGRTTSPALQAAVVDLIDTTVCDQLLKPSCNRNWCGIRDNQICAGKLAGGVDACQGDSGGPLQVKIPLPITTEGNMHYIVGVTLFGIGCALPNLPGIYSRVSTYLDWIESIYINGVLPTDAKIINIIVHPKYHPLKKYYDIALMELKYHVVFSKYVQPACLWTMFNTTSLGTEATLTGWALWKPILDVHDVGGPLNANMHYIVSVTSFGIGCALPNLPGIYSRVSMYLDWIESVVWP